MKFRSIGLLLCISLLSVCPAAMAQEKYEATYGSGANAFSLATGSPGELGLLEALAKGFSQKTDATLLWKKAGSGESLKALKDKKVDMIMVHAPAAEKKAVEEGWARKRVLIGSNEFFIVGPANDPAKISGARDAADAYTRIAGAEARYFSRGDHSGTHKKEMDIWKKAGITPSGEWYIKTGEFMTATLKRANAEKGYFMTDSSTWVAEKKNVPNLKILFRGD
ncbi:MAG: substrate-binding domain-containing protein, partial [Syntrophobacteraceae bacterium]